MGFILYVQNVKKTKQGLRWNPNWGAESVDVTLKKHKILQQTWWVETSEPDHVGQGSWKCGISHEDRFSSRHLQRHVQNTLIRTVCADCDGKFLLLNVCRVWNVCDRHRSEIFSAHWCLFVFILWFRAENVPGAHPVVRVWKLRYLQQDEVVEYRRIFKHTTERKGQSHSMHLVLDPGQAVKSDDLTPQLWPLGKMMTIAFGGTRFSDKPISAFLKNHITCTYTPCPLGDFPGPIRCHMVVRKCVVQRSHKRTN